MKTPSQKPLILALDTALGSTSIVLMHEGKILAEHWEEGHGRQSQYLLTWIAEVLQRAGVTYRELDLLASTVGPGGFTSIRVGLATVRALALAANLPTQGFSTLEVMAYGVQHASPLRGEGRLLCLLPAGRGYYFVQGFNGGNPLGEARLLKEEALAEEMCLFEEVASIAPEMPSGITGKHFRKHAIRDNARLVAEMAARQPGQTPLVPLYVRPPDAKLSTPLLPIAHPPL